MTKEAIQLLLDTQNALLESTNRQLREYHKTILALMRLMERTSIPMEDINRALAPALLASQTASFALIGIVPAAESGNA